jgi:V/A-type H+-transporting ATPase subunit G/H
VAELSIRFDELIEEERKAIRLIEEAKAKAEKIVAEAKKKAQSLIDKATKTEHIRAMLKEEEEKAKGEAEGILEEYRRRLTRFREVPESSIMDAADLVVREVLRFE